MKMNKKEFIFLYDAKNTIPNGDPFTGEQRYDEESSKALVSDVRIKRYIRDFLDNDPFNEGDIVFYSDKTSKGTTEERKKELENLLNIKTLDELKEKCIDIRLFGVVTSEKKDNKLTGAVQFMMFNPSINKVDLVTTQNTTIMTSKSGKTQGSIATFSYVPYGLFIVTGYFNPIVGEENGVSERDIQKMIIALWQEINSKNTRSKNSQTSRLLIEINYKDNYSKIADLDEAFSVKDKEYRNFEEIKKDLDFSKLKELINKNKDIIESVNVYLDENSFSKDEFDFEVDTKFFTIKGLNIKEI
jgi:CRISPR-associated protein Csh2